MAKCPKCSTRKAKRPCPALGTQICAPCCAENRLKTIACPQDCPYLKSEVYQHGRRKERALSRGKRFVDASAKLFPESEPQDFAFKLQADIYFHTREHGAVDDDTMARALESLMNSFAKIYIPEAALNPLAAFLADRLHDEGRFPLREGFNAEGRLRVLKTLLNHIRALGGAGSYRYHEEISGFFDALDFEADLDYSPFDDADSSGNAEEVFQQRKGGLFLPPGAGG